MYKIALLLSSFTLVSCVGGPPQLTAQQFMQLEKIELYKEGDKPSKKYEKIEEISAADCSGAPGGGRVWGKSKIAIGVLKMKAASKNADAVINIDCSSVPFVNNCWAAQKCDGIAVKWIK